MKGTFLALCNPITNLIPEHSQVKAKEDNNYDIRLNIIGFLGELGLSNNIDMDNLLLCLITI